jgi:hypothetical protein
VITCVSAAGEKLAQDVVSSQVFDSIKAKVMKQGFRFWFDLILRKRDQVYVNTELFKEYFQTVFIPYVKCLRRFAEFAEKETVFLMNNYGSHTNDEILTRLAKN